MERFNSQSMSKTWTQEEFLERLGLPSEHPGLKKMAITNQKNCDSGKESLSLIGGFSTFSTSVENSSCHSDSSIEYLRKSFIQTYLVSFFDDKVSFLELIRGVNFFITSAYLTKIEKILAPEQWKDILPLTFLSQILNTAVESSEAVSSKAYPIKEMTAIQAGYSLNASMKLMFRPSVVYSLLSCVRPTFHILLRMFAPLMLVASFLCIISFSKKRPYKTNRDIPENFLGAEAKVTMFVASCFALLSSSTMLLDAGYVQNFSRLPLVFLFFLTICLIHVKGNSKYSSALIFSAVALALFFSLEDLDLPQVRPGFYFNEENPLSVKMKDYFSMEELSYSREMTKWIITGDLRALFPFLFNIALDLPYTRRWVPLENERDEAVALDIFFPSDGFHRMESPLYLILHGYNGGSDDAYIRDFIDKQRARGSTVAVMVSRGMMGSPIINDTLPNFARTSDVHATVKALRKLQSHNQTIAGLGYSMGGVILANYVAKYGNDCQLDVAISISSALDARKQIKFKRSKLMWEPLITGMMKLYIEKNFRHVIKHLEEDIYLKFLYATDVPSLDEAISRHHGYIDTYHYYSDMSVLGDYEANSTGRIENVSIPLLFVNALDDAFGTWRCLHDPYSIVNSGAGNVFMLITEYGGHVGWPTGLNPAKDGWKFIHTVTSNFVTSYEKAYKYKFPGDHGNTLFNIERASSSKS